MLCLRYSILRKWTALQDQIFYLYGHLSRLSEGRFYLKQIYRDLLFPSNPLLQSVQEYLRPINFRQIQLIIQQLFWFSELPPFIYIFKFVDEQLEPISNQVRPLPYLPPFDWRLSFHKYLSKFFNFSHQNIVSEQCTFKSIKGSLNMRVVYNSFIVLAIDEWFDWIDWF